MWASPSQSFYQYPNPIRPEVENTYPLGPAHEHGSTVKKLTLTFWPQISDLYTCIGTPPNMSEKPNVKCFTVHP